MKLYPWPHSEGVTVADIPGQHAHTTVSMQPVDLQRTGDGRRCWRVTIDDANGPARACVVSMPDAPARPDFEHAARVALRKAPREGYGKRLPVYA